MKKMKSPLRYPGGKQRIVPLLTDKLPENISEYREPFLGGGSVYFHIQYHYPHIQNWWVNDKFQPLYNFWKQLSINPQNIQSSIKSLRSSYPDGRTLHKALRMGYNGFSNPVEAAAAFYILNRCSFSGLTFSGGYSQAAYDTRLTESGLKALPLYQPLLNNINITNEDYTSLLNADGNNVFIFMDPPYDIKASTLYGKNGNTHKDFDHVAFAENCRKCGHKWMITYNDNANIRDLFSWANIHEIPVLYSMNSNSKKTIELVITNY
jgi:DNA adenine methylase